MRGTKHDTGKVPLEYLPTEALEEVSRVLGFGATKYEPWNWTKGIRYARIIGAILRHIFAYLRGVDKDPETGLSHMAHAACGCLFLLHYEKYSPHLDDRYKPSKHKASIKRLEKQARSKK